MSKDLLFIMHTLLPHCMTQDKLKTYTVTQLRVTALRSVSCLAQTLGQRPSDVYDKDFPCSGELESVDLQAGRGTRVRVVGYG